MAAEQQQLTKERTMQDVQNDFGRLCQKAGHLQYEITIKNKDLELLNSTIKDLNFEAAAIQAKLQEQEQKAKEQALAVEAALKAEKEKNLPTVGPTPSGSSVENQAHNQENG